MWCSSGYFGVDIFLLITGYLLFSSNSVPNTSYGEFILKKIWRLAPAVICVAVLVGVLGAFCLQHDLFIVVAKTIRATVLGFSNEYMARNGSYFAPATQDNPLMHLWYIGLVMQVYLVVPLFIKLTRNVRPVVYWFVYTAIFLVSFLVFLYVRSGEEFAFVQPWMHGVESIFPNYYSMFPRLWEVFLGGYVALLPRMNGKVENALGVLGLAYVVVAMFSFPANSGMVFFSLLAAMCVVRYGSGGLAGRILGDRIVQYVGTISFSLYLTHWPIISLKNYICYTDKYHIISICCVLLSVFLAILLYKSVESKSGVWAKRYSFKNGNRFVFGVSEYKSWFCVIFVLLTSALCAHVWTKPGRVAYWLNLYLPESELCRVMGCQLPPVTAAELDSYPVDILDSKPYSIGENMDIPCSFFLMGDSHAEHLLYGLNKTLTKDSGMRGMYINRSCLPAADCDMGFVPGIAYRCWNEAFHSAFVEWISKNDDIKCVIISNYWRLRFRFWDPGFADEWTPPDRPDVLKDWSGAPVPLSDHRRHIEAGLIKTCRQLLRAGKKVLIIQDTPFFELKEDHVNRYERRWLVGLPYQLPDISKQEYARSVQKEDDFFRYLQENKLAYVLNVNSALESGGVYPIRKDGVFLYLDSNHITRRASMLVAPLIIEWLQKNI